MLWLFVFIITGACVVAVYVYYNWRVCCGFLCCKYQLINQYQQFGLKFGLMRFITTEYDDGDNSKWSLIGVVLYGLFQNYVKLESVRKLLKITRLASLLAPIHMKS